LSRVKNIGIEGVKPPDKTCNDPKCPWHGYIKVRGVLLKGIVVKTKMQKTVVVKHEYLHYDRKYMRYEKRRSHIHAHKPPCISVDVGDEVLIGETRPLAKTVAFVVLQVVKKGGVTGG